MTRAAHVRMRVAAVMSAALALALIALPQPFKNAAPSPAAAIQRLPIGPAVPAIAQMPMLFTDGLADPVAAEEALGLPTLIGIAGRLPDDVEVLLRLREGSTRSVRIGESIEGWTLRSVAPDRAIFERGGRQKVLTIAPLP